jgi:hypothetical protein
MSDVAPVLGLLAGLMAVAGMIPYIRDTLGRSTRPHRGTWLIWGALAIAVCMSQRAEGASWSLVMNGSQVVLNILVILLAIRLGTGGVSAIDTTLIAIAGAGVAGWLIADEPIVAITCVVAADLIATGMMLPKTWRDPDSETLSAYAIGSLVGALAAGSVGALEPSLLLYPLYYCLANGALALLIRQRRAVHRRGEQVPPSSVIAVRAYGAVAP